MINWTPASLSSKSANEEWASFIRELASLDNGEVEHVESDSDPDLRNETKSTELTEVEEYTTELAHWATESSIPASSVSGLLSVLRHYHPSLPKIQRQFSRLHAQHPSN